MPRQLPPLVVFGGHIVLTAFGLLNLLRFVFYPACPHLLHALLVSLLDGLAIPT